MAEARATPACQAKGGKYVDGNADFDPGHNREGGTGSRTMIVGTTTAGFTPGRNIATVILVR